MLKFKMARRLGSSSTIGLLTILVILDLSSNPVHGGSDNKPKKCQEITIPMCRGIGYNQTYMPNQFNHDTQVRNNYIYPSLVLL